MKKGLNKESLIVTARSENERNIMAMRPDLRPLPKLKVFYIKKQL